MRLRVQVRALKILPLSMERVGSHASSGKYGSPLAFLQSFVLSFSLGDCLLLSFSLGDEGGSSRIAGVKGEQIREFHFSFPPIALFSLAPRLILSWIPLGKGNPSFHASLRPPDRLGPNSDFQRPCSRCSAASSIFFLLLRCFPSQPTLMFRSHGSLLFPRR